MTQNTEGSVNPTNMFWHQIESFLFGIVVGFTVWGAGIGFVWLLNWLGAYLNIYPPDSQIAAYVIELMYLNIPWIAGIAAGFIGYRLLLRLE